MTIFTGVARYGRKGFTQRGGIALIINQYVDDLPSGGAIAHFRGMTPDDLARLAKLLPQGNREEGLDAPSIDRFVELAQDLPASTRFSGYLVSPDRTDERVTIDGLEIPLADLTARDVAEMAYRWPISVDGDNLVAFWD
jgi:hypothetical protein